MGHRDTDRTQERQDIFGHSAPIRPLAIALRLSGTPQIYTELLRFSPLTNRGHPFTIRSRPEIEAVLPNRRIAGTPNCGIAKGQGPQLPPGSLSQAQQVIRNVACACACVRRKGQTGLFFSMFIFAKWPFQRIIQALLGKSEIRATIYHTP